MLEDIFIIGSMPKAAVEGHYNYFLVALSYLVASVASYVALDISSNIVQNRKSEISPEIWLYSGSFVMGAGIWSMHFIGMLAYNSGMRVEYNFWITLASMIVAIIFSYFALSRIKTNNLTTKEILKAAPILGLGIATMHYSGMAAMEMRSEIKYLPSLFTISILVAIAASAAALAIATKSSQSAPGKQTTLKISSALIMGIAICGMHYTGMKATIFIPYPDCEINFNLFEKNLDLALIIAEVALVILGLAITASILNQKFVKHLQSKIESTTQELIAASCNAKMNSIRTSMILNNIIDGVITTDIDGEIQSFNKAAESIFGYEESEIIGENISVLIPKKHSKNHYKYFKKYIETKKSEVIGNGWFEIKGLKKNGQTFHMSLGINELKMDKDYVFIGVVRDITEQKKHERELKRSKNTAERATKAKSDFLANMSHEIRTPMNAVIGMTGLLLDTKLNSKQRTYAEIVRNSGEALLDLINDILDFSKIEAGQLSLEPIPFSLYTSIEEIVDLLNIKAKEQGIDILVNYHSNVPHFFLGDPGRIRQIIINLMGNSIKFTKKGHVLLNIKLKKTQNNIANLSFKVQDTGIGIPEDKQNYIFNKFSQAEESTTRKFGGTGLGLAICKNLISMMDGKISVQSELGKGSTFKFNLKIPVAKESDAEEKEIRVKADNADITNLRALIIEESEVSGNIIHQYLNDKKIYTDLSYTIPQSLKLLEKSVKDKTPYHIIFISSKVGRTKWPSIVAKLKSKTKLKDSIIIMVASAYDAFSEEELLANGIIGLISKPVYPFQLINTIDVAWSYHLKKKYDNLVTKHSLNEILRKRLLIKKSSDSQNDFKGTRVLIVEDMPVNQMLMVTILKKYDCRSDTAANGLEAVKALKEMAYDIVFMDCQMPEMDGFEATREIRKIEKTTGNHTPIIALTADAMQEDKENCLRSGMDDYLNKPVKADKIESMLAKYVKKQ